MGCGNRIIFCPLVLALLETRETSQFPSVHFCARPRHLSTAWGASDESWSGGRAEVVSRFASPKTRKKVELRSTGAAEGGCPHKRHRAESNASFANFAVMGSFFRRKSIDLTAKNAKKGREVREEIQSEARLGGGVA